MTSVKIVLFCSRSEHALQAAGVSLRSFKVNKLSQQQGQGNNSLAQWLIARIANPEGPYISQYISKTIALCHIQIYMSSKSSDWRDARIGSPGLPHSSAAGRQWHAWESLAEGTRAKAKASCWFVDDLRGYCANHNYTASQGRLSKHKMRIFKWTPWGWFAFEYCQACKEEGKNKIK